MRSSRVPAHVRSPAVLLPESLRTRRDAFPNRVQAPSSTPVEPTTSNSPAPPLRRFQTQWRVAAQTLPLRLRAQPAGDPPSIPCCSECTPQHTNGLTLPLALQSPCAKKNRARTACVRVPSSGNPHPARGSRPPYRGGRPYSPASQMLSLRRRAPHLTLHGTHHSMPFRIGEL